MRPNPVLRKLGLADDDRAVIIHMDDVGSSHAANAAYFDLIEFGSLSSAAIMAPCPWFPQAAAFCRAHPEVDMGAHLTLNSEWNDVRWSPISTSSPATGLVDEEGYFYRRQPPVRERADLDAVYIELKAQIDRMLAAGIDLTHADSHMAALIHPRLMPVYVRVALEYRLPPTVIFRGDEAAHRQMGLEGEILAQAVELGNSLEDQGVPLLDYAWGMPLDKPDNRLETAKRAFAALPPGITHFFMHPCHDTPELRDSVPDWPNRTGDYEVFMMEELRQFIKDQGIHVIGNRALRDIMRAAL